MQIITDYTIDMVTILALPEHVLVGTNIRVQLPVNEPAFTDFFSSPPPPVTSSILSVPAGYTVREVDRNLFVSFFSS